MGGFELETIERVRLARKRAKFRDRVLLALPLSLFFYYKFLAHFNSIRFLFEAEREKDNQGKVTIPANDDGWWAQR